MKDHNMHFRWGIKNTHQNLRKLSISKVLKIVIFCCVFIYIDLKLVKLDLHIILCILLQYLCIYRELFLSG